MTHLPIEILPRISISMLNLTVSDFHNFSMDHNMTLINFMLNPNFILRQLVVGSNAIERVST